MPVKKRKKRRLGSSVNGCHRRRAEAPNDVWCWDFVFDRTVAGSNEWVWARCTSSRGALGRTATPRVSTGGSGEMSTTPSGLTARWVIGPGPGLPPRVRLPPRPRPRLQPHTLVALVNPVPKPSYHLVQETQPGHLNPQRKFQTTSSLPHPQSTQHRRHCREFSNP